ncbi:MAG: RNA methyltransferase [Prevotellaceae bacterium]|jgi:TrmH family RNA methyltransferase|nr:RNA methyltransferase [Prevotellaceae bacterium]
METIASLQNPRVKGIAALADKARERRESGLFVLEGARELGLALQGGYRLQTLLVCRELWGAHRPLPVAAQHLEVSPAVFEKLAYRAGSDGLLAVAEQKDLRTERLHLSGNPFVLVLEAVEKPGNLGAILRTADAAGVDAVLVCDPQCDVYNPNVVRSSVGCLFTNQVACCTSGEALAFVRGQGLRVLAAELQASRWYHEADMRSPCAVVVGAEADGLTDFWLANADARIKIPMRGAIDSLNVSVSTAVITFEAMRQRGFSSGGQTAVG